jgi:hypothetical protein
VRSTIKLIGILKMVAIIGSGERSLKSLVVALSSS